MGKGTPGSFEILLLSAAVAVLASSGDGDMSAGCVSQPGKGICLGARGAVGSLVLSCPAVSTTFLLSWLPVHALPGTAVPIADH